MADDTLVTETAPGTFRVEYQGTREIVYVAGSGSDRWAFWHGHVFRSKAAPTPERENTSLWRPPSGEPTAVRLKPDTTYGDSGSSATHEPETARTRVVESLSAPVPAKVSKVLVSPGASVKKGDTLVVLEAMKMEWPIRAPSSGTIKAVHCREGQLVQPEHALVDLE